MPTSRDSSGPAGGMMTVTLMTSRYSNAAAPLMISINPVKLYTRTVIAATGVELHGGNAIRR